jgi:hypothetical protein
MNMSTRAGSFETLALSPSSSEPALATPCVVAAITTLRPGTGSGTTSVHTASAPPIDTPIARRRRCWAGNPRRATSLPPISTISRISPAADPPPTRSAGPDANAGAFGPAEPPDEAITLALTVTEPPSGVTLIGFASGSDSSANVNWTGLVPTAAAVNVSVARVPAPSGPGKPPKVAHAKRTDPTSRMGEGQNTPRPVLPRNEPFATFTKLNKLLSYARTNS